MGQKGHQNLELDMEHEYEVIGDRSVSPLSGHEMVSVMSIAPNSQSASPPDRKTEERSSSRKNKRTTHSGKWKGTTSPSRSAGRESGVKLRILSVEVGYCTSFFAFVDL